MTTRPLCKYISKVIRKEGNYGANHLFFFLSSDKYTQAIGKSRDKRDNQTIYGNRSWIYSRQSNYKKGLVDANKTIEINYATPVRPFSPSFGRSSSC